MKIMAHLLAFTLWALIGCGNATENGSTAVEEIHVEPVYEQFEQKDGNRIHFNPTER